MLGTSVVVLLGNVGGAALMARFGLPSVVPLIGGASRSKWRMRGNRADN
jgi:hypothetical protein